MRQNELGHFRESERELFGITSCTLKELIKTSKPNFKI